jgi:hypothetical protein
VAVTAVGSALTEAHRAAQLANQAGSLSGLVRLWRAVDPTRLSDTIDVFTQAAVLLTQQGSAASAGLSSTYYSLFRRIELGGKAISVPLANQLATDVLAGQIRGAALSGIINARKAGRSVEVASRNGLVKALGTVSKLVQAGGRATLTGAIHSDRRALGWLRVTSGSPCAFCAMISGRGAVYKSERGASFETHDHCSCAVEPYYDNHAESTAFAGQSEEHAGDYQAAQDWARQAGTLSSGTSNNALNNYRRYLAAGKPTPGDGGTEDSGA